MYTFENRPIDWNVFSTGAWYALVNARWIECGSWAQGAVYVTIRDIEYGE